MKNEPLYLYKYWPTEECYLHCKECGDLLPANSICSLRCTCGAILLDYDSRRHVRMYIDHDKVHVVKCSIRVPSSRSSRISYHLKALLLLFRVNRFILSETNKSIDLVNDMALKMSSEESFSLLESKLDQLTISSLNHLEIQSWYYHYGTVLRRRNAHGEALQMFKKGSEEYPSDQLMKFCLGQQYLFLNQPDKAFSEFDCCHFPKVIAKLILIMADYAYLHGEYERGLRYLTQLYECYLNVKVLDDHVLYMRGLSFFSDYWCEFVGLHLFLDKKDELYNAFEKIKNTCVN